MTAYTFAEFVENVATREPKDCRRFGVEIETPHASKIEADGFDKTHDPSVADSDCECDCDSCNHSCDCGNCSITNGYDDNEHCGDCTANELALLYSYGTRTDGQGAIERTCKELQEVDSDHTDHYRGHPYGGHIHTEARDLTPRQVASVMRLYNKAEALYPAEFFGRETNDYCSAIGKYAMDMTSNGCEIDRMSAINTQNYFAYRYQLQRGYINEQSKFKSTLEFRQFASTNDWKMTLTRVAFCIALVEFAKNNSAIYWALRSTTWQEFAKVIGH